MAKVLLFVIVLYLLPLLESASSSPLVDSRWCHQSSTVCSVPDPSQHNRCFDIIFQFGDSLGDAGNYATLRGNSSYGDPNGYTWPGCFKGRFSDGRLLVDYYATAFGVQLPRPSQACSCGTNFAIANATALPTARFARLNISVSTSHSIKDELKWYKKYLSTYQCPRASNGLYILGIGGVDYILAAQAGTSTESMIQDLVPEVVHKITNAIKTLVTYGARNIIVENIPPVGCTPRMLTDMESTDQIDSMGCLANFGLVIHAHNRRLSQAIFRELDISSSVIVAVEDRYSAFLDVWSNPSTNNIQNERAACCGAGGPYNYNSSDICGMPGAKVCEFPSRSLFWDSLHFTDHYNDIASRFFLSGKYINSTVGADPFTSMC